MGLFKIFWKDKSHIPIAESTGMLDKRFKAKTKFFSIKNIIKGIFFLIILAAVIIKMTTGTNIFN